MFSGTTRQYLAASSACIAAFSSGCTFGWSAPVLKQLLSDSSPIPMTPDESSWVIAIIELGNYISPIPTGFIVDRIGRKWTLLATGPITAISWLIALYSRTVFGLYTMRTLQGFSMATCYMITPMYIGEISEDRIRGTIGTIFQISSQLGILYTYVLGSELSYFHFTIASLIVPIIFIVTFVFMPESPHYYISKKEEKKAIESLKWLRNTSEEGIQAELKLIKESVNSSRTKSRTSFREFIGKSNMQPFVTIIFIIVFRSFTGVQSIIAYANTVFESTDTFMNPKYVSVLFAVMLLFSIFPSTYFIDKAGRRVLFLTSSFGCAVSSFIAYVYYYTTINLHYSIPYTNWIPFVSISMLGVFFNLGFGSLFAPLMSEYFSSNMKAASSTILNIWSTTFGLLSYKLFYVLNENVGIYSNFLFSFVCCFISTIYLYFYLLETKGKSFVEIQYMFKYGKPMEPANPEVNNRDVLLKSESV